MAQGAQRGGAKVRMQFLNLVEVMAVGKSRVLRVRGGSLSLAGKQALSRTAKLSLSTAGIFSATGTEAW